MKNEIELGWFIEWDYTPKDFFEEPININQDLYDLTIEDGKIVARVAVHAGDPRPCLGHQIHKRLYTMFIGVQLVCHQSYRLSEPSFHYQDQNGRTVFLETLTLTSRLSVGADFIIKDKDGNIVADSKSERINRKHLLATLAAKYGVIDPVAAKILESYHNAISDAGNCLVHLYEIKDALTNKFGREQVAWRKLKVAKARWRELRRLANDAPLKQGRHRGKMVSKLRDATKKELDTAMGIGAEMIEKYINYLDEANS